MGSILKAILVASLVLGGSWVVLMLAGFWVWEALSLREEHGIDSGPIVVPMLAMWPVAVFFGIRQERLNGVVAWVATGLGTIFLTFLLTAAAAFVLILMLMAQ